MYISGIEDDPDLDLQEMMNRVFDNYPDEFREYWGLDDSHEPERLDAAQWERYRELDRLAKKIASLGAVLTRPPKLLEDAENQFFLASLQLYLTDYLVWPAILADRVVDLTQYTARVRTHRALQYLSRVSRCYLYAMNAELAVMARAALEAAPEDLIPEEQVREIRRIPRHLRVGLSDYIEVAARAVLSDEAAKAARDLKRLGDDSIHVSADIVGDPHVVLENLVVVLK